MNAIKPVLFRVTNNLKIGGVQRRLRALLPLLTDAFEVHVVTYKEKGVLFDELSGLGVRTHYMPRKGHWSPAGIRRLAALFRTHRADIVHTHSFGGNISGLLAATLARVPVRVGQVHLSELHWYGRTALRRRKQMLEETLVHRLCSHRVLFVSRESRDYFQRHTGLPDRLLTVLHNGLALPDAVTPASRRELGVPEGRSLIGFVGRITRGKGADAFLGLAREAAGQDPARFHFLVIGDGEGLNALKSKAMENGMSDHITFLGERRDIHRCYAALDGLVFCSEPGVEGMPGVALEACAHGLPILARRTPPIEEIGAYYSRIAFLEGNRPFAEQISSALALPPADQKRFRDEFSIEAMQLRTERLYSELFRQVCP